MGRNHRCASGLFLLFHLLLLSVHHGRRVGYLCLWFWIVIARRRVPMVFVRLERGGGLKLALGFEPELLIVAMFRPAFLPQLVRAEGDFIVRGLFLVGHILVTDPRERRSRKCVFGIVCRPRRSLPLLRMLPRMDAFGDFLQHLFVETRDIVRLSAGDESVVDDDFFIDPLGPCVLQIGFY